MIQSGATSKQGSPATTAAPAKRAEPPRSVTQSLAPLPAKQFGFVQARHLLWRAGLGGTPDQIQLLVRWGLDKSVDYLVNYEKIEPGDAISPQAKADVMGGMSATERADYRRALQSRDEDTLARIRLMRQQQEQADRDQMRDVQRWWLKRMIETPRPLEEKMTLLWHGHFATSFRTVENSWHMTLQNAMFRKHATGSFADLLLGIIRDPAMLKYLNNDTSRKDRPNENLARELMELFGLGVGNYGERDIKEGARALTGYTFRDNEFFFDRRNHDNGVKSILGAQGAMDGEAFVNAILRQPACAEFACRKIYNCFVSDYPSGRTRHDQAAKSVVAQLASQLREGDYQLKPVLGRLLRSQHFYDPSVIGEQIKSPVQLVVGAVRSLRTPVRDLGVLADAMDRMGQSVFMPPSVKGWDGGRSWINTATLFIRQNLLVFLLSGKRPQGRDPMADTEPFKPAGLLAQLADAYPGADGSKIETILDALLDFTLGRSNPAGRPALEQFLATRPGKPDDQTITELLLLITAMPEYQLC